MNGSAIENNIEGLIREARKVKEDLEMLRLILRPSIQEKKIRTCIDDFESKMIDKCIEQGSETISVPITEIIDLKNRIGRILVEKK